MPLSSLKKVFKMLGLVFLLVVALLASILAGRTASRYFAKAASCPAINVKAVQVGTNNAVINWETKDETQGRVQYGTDPQNLSISAEATSGRMHNVPLTLLTPNTPYYFLVAIGNNFCDDGGSQGCDKDHPEKCTPWTFTTAAIIPQEEPVAPLSDPLQGIPSPTSLPPVVPPTVVIIPSLPPTLSVPTATGSAATGTELSAFCQMVQQNIGGSESSSNWTAIKQYDIDVNGVINGLDVFKCKESGK